MNFHDDKWILDRVHEHLEEAKEYFPEDRIVGIFLQGSQNYGLDVEGSDIDTKLIVTPSFEDIVLNKKAVSTTHVRENNEHIDWKDVRLYMETFRKQNLNFLEILFTDYLWINPLYRSSWNKLVAAREDIARMNEFRAVKSMKGIAMEKYHAMEHPYPSKMEILEKYGYDGKQVHHLLRVEEYLERYINGEPYIDCLHPREDSAKLLMDLKEFKYDLEEGRELANDSIRRVTEMADAFCDGKENEENLEMRKLLETVQYEIIKTSILKEIKEDDMQREMAYLWRLP